MHGNISSLGGMQGERAHVNCYPGGCMTWAHLIGELQLTANEGQDHL